MTKHFFFALLSLFGLLCSCRYQSGSGDLKGTETLFIQVVSNDTLLPQAGGIVSRTVREEFLRKGSFVLVLSPDEADFLLRVKLYEYSKSPEVFRPGDTLEVIVRVSLSNELQMFEGFLPIPSFFSDHCGSKKRFGTDLNQFVLPCQRCIGSSFGKIFI